MSELKKLELRQEQLQKTNNELQRTINDVKRKVEMLRELEQHKAKMWKYDIQPQNENHILLQSFILKCLNANDLYPKWKKVPENIRALFNIRHENGITISRDASEWIEKALENTVFEHYPQLNSRFDHHEKVLLFDVVLKATYVSYYDYDPDEGQSFFVNDDKVEEIFFDTYDESDDESDSEDGEMSDSTLSPKFVMRTLIALAKNSSELRQALFTHGPVAVWMVLPEHWRIHNFYRS